MPQRSLLAHLGNSRHRERLCDWKVVEGSELIPQLPPAIDISVRYVEDFVACFVFTQSPQSRAPEQLCVCCLLKSITAADDLLFLHALPESLKRTRLSGEVDLYEQSPAEGFRRQRPLAGVRVTIAGQSSVTEAFTDRDGLYE